MWSDRIHWSHCAQQFCQLTDCLGAWLILTGDASALFYRLKFTRKWEYYICSCGINCFASWYTTCVNWFDFALDLLPWLFLICCWINISPLMHFFGFSWAKMCLCPLTGPLQYFSHDKPANAHTLDHYKLSHRSGSYNPSVRPQHPFSLCLLQCNETVQHP